MEDFLEMLLSFGIIFGIGYGIYAIVKYVQVKKAQREKKKKEQLMEQFDNMIVTLARVGIQKSIEDLNFDYGLGLYDGSIYAIAQADDPLAELPKYIDPAPTTLETFKNEIISKVDIFLRSSTLAADEQRAINENILEEFESVDEELVVEIADEYSRQLDKKMYFLKGKINYTLAALGLLQGLAEDTDNLELSEHIQLIRRKRGFID